jgi:Flp pilus assembly pilin Flp
MGFLRDEVGAETSEIALVLGLLIVGAAAMWGFLKSRIEAAVQNAGSTIGGGG